MEFLGFAIKIAILFLKRMILAFGIAFILCTVGFGIQLVFKRVVCTTSS